MKASKCGSLYPCSVIYEKNKIRSELDQMVIWRFTVSNTFRTRTGFLAVWTASSEPPTYPPTLKGCDNCDFPFEFGDVIFDTCISVQDVDTQPWCSYNITTPVINDYPYPKISCSDSDSSCPSSPSQTVITSPDYPQSYPTNADQVK